jgi:positive regulator of sigma E activity
MTNTVCGTIEGVFDSEVRVIVDRKAACKGCQATGVCHGFTKNRMDLLLSRPTGSVSVGDTVVIAMEGSSLLKASTFAFMVPLAAILAALFLAQAAGTPVVFQALGAVLAFAASLAAVRRLGNRIEAPKIIEVIHEE